MGVPVVISTNGFGRPVKVVEKNAPVLEVSPNGFGIPIVLSDLGAPFILQGGGPGPQPYDWAADSAIYVSNDAAPAGTITTLTTLGSWSAAFTTIAVTKGANAVMEADGLKLRGNNLRSQGGKGTWSKLTLMFDMTFDAAPFESTGNMFTINPGTAAQRLLTRVTTAGVVQVLGPSGGGGNHAQIAAFGQRQVFGCELDTVAGLLTLIDADGYRHSYTQPTGPISITDIQMGRAVLGKIHRLSLQVEA